MRVTLRQLQIPVSFRCLSCCPWTQIFRAEQMMEDQENGTVDGADAAPDRRCPAFREHEWPITITFPGGCPSNIRSPVSGQLAGHRIPTADVCGRFDICVPTRFSPPTPRKWKCMSAASSPSEYRTGPTVISPCRMGTRLTHAVLHLCKTVRSHMPPTVHRATEGQMADDVAPSTPPAAGAAPRLGEVSCNSCCHRGSSCRRGRIM